MEKINRCFLLFPRSEEKLWGILDRYIKSKFDIDCFGRVYDSLDKKAIHEINLELKEPCILVLGYAGDLSQENCYQLGLAHAHENKVILISLNPNLAIPEYIRYHLLIRVQLERTVRLSEFIQRFSDAFQVMIKGDLQKFLYQMANNICDDVEQMTDKKIARVSNADFRKSIRNDDVDAFFNDHNALFVYLLLKISTKPEDLQDILYEYEMQKREYYRKQERTEAILEIFDKLPGGNMSKNIQPKSAWANGLFYLFVFLVVIASLGVLANSVPFYALALILVAGVIFVPLIGAFQLRQDDRIPDKSFLALVKMVIGQLPLIGRAIKPNKSKK